MAAKTPKTPKTPKASAAPRVVALGGGHGLYATLQALRHVAGDITAVVTVADDGGSSGRLREELGALPPGDLRMALAALTEDTEWGRTWSSVLQHRFTGAGPLRGHAVGNLLIASLWEQLGDPVEGLDWVGRLLSAQGRVLPMASVPLVVSADVVTATGRSRVVGQSNVAKAVGRLEHLQLEPVDPSGCPEAIDAVGMADWVIMGPGSWYTSVLVHLLVPDLAAALHHTKARRCLTMNLGTDTETAGLGVVDHLTALHELAPDLRFDVVLVDPDHVDDVGAAAVAAQQLGATLVVRHMAMRDGSARHDPLRLAAAYRDVFDGHWSR